MSRALNDLSDRFRPLAIELIARCVEQQIQIMIVDTLRTPEEQKANLVKGVSWTMDSKHLPQPPHGKAEAIDVCPYEVYTLAKGGDKLQWDAHHPAWMKIVEIGESLGLQAGARWRVRDMGHFEWKDS